MRIAILGWGSLIWDPRDLPREGVWQQGGPILRIEFSRISSDARLTLVIDGDNGAAVLTRFALSPRADLQDAISDLKWREGTESEKIGYVDLRHNRRRSRIEQVGDSIRDWAREHEFDGVVWTDLEPNFPKERGIAFSVRAAEEYLQGLPRNVQARARKYIQNAPPEVNTPLRNSLRDSGWLEN